MNNIIEAAKNFALEEIQEYGTPYITHLEISRNKALELAKLYSADPFIVEVGAYLMDVKLGQALKEGRIEDHVRMSADATKKFLSQFDIDEARKNKIINCVEAHHQDVPFICREAEICSNADCYRMAHPKGFFGYLMLLGSRNPNFQENLRQAEMKLEEKHGLLTLPECRQELEAHYVTLKALITEAKNLK